MEKVVKTITGKTMIPLSLVVTLLGGGGYITKANMNVNRNTEVLNIVNSNLDKHIQSKVTQDRQILEMLIEIERKLAKIEGKLSK